MALANTAIAVTTNIGNPANIFITREAHPASPFHTDDVK